MISSYIRVMRCLLIFLFFSTSFVLYAQDFDESIGPQAQAAAAMRSKRYREAEDLYRQLLQKNPESMTYKHLLSHSLIGQVRFHESDSVLRVAYQQDSLHPGTYWYWGLLAERQNQYVRAYVFFRKYIDRSKRFSEFNQSAWLHAGSSYRRKMHQEGIHALEWADMIYCYENYLQSQPADPMIPALKDFLDSARTKQPQGNEKLVWDEQ